MKAGDQSEYGKKLEIVFASLATEIVNLLTRFFHSFFD